MGAVEQDITVNEFAVLPCYEKMLRANEII